MEGISCGFCHQVGGPVRPGDAYQGNAFWTSPASGRRFSSRPEDRLGKLGISNSGYKLAPAELLINAAVPEIGSVIPGAHRRPSASARAYLRSSEFCGTCHDVRLFGTDSIGVVERGEHFKRLRNAYSEWRAWADKEERSGRKAASCQDCHMSSYPGICEKGSPKADILGALRNACPPGTRFRSVPPGTLPRGRVATTSAERTPLHPHYFSGVDVPLDSEFSDALIDDSTLDVAGLPLGSKQRRDILLARSVRLSLGSAERRGGNLSLPVVIENSGAGHRIPAGFSQERELWLHLKVSDGSGRVLYEVGRVERDDEDLRDKQFLRVNVDDRLVDGQGRPLGLFGADVIDGPDVPLFSPPPAQGGTRFRGRGLVNFQNGFLRCVVCIGRIDAQGTCQPAPGQERSRADRYADGAYDIDTGACRSNLSGEQAFFETYFPVGALDASRGVFKAADAIIDTRSLEPGVPVTYTYDLPLVSTARLRVEARLLFRAFPPFLLRAFIDYERLQQRVAKGLPGR